MKHTFKRGDKVIRIGPSRGNIIKGETYTVHIEKATGVISLVEFGIHEGWFTRWFIPVKKQGSNEMQP